MPLLNPDGPLHWFPGQTMNCILLLAMVALPASLTQAHAQTVSPASNLQNARELEDLRNVHAEWDSSGLKLATSQAESYAWAVIPSTKGGWDVARRATIAAEITNTGSEPAGVLFWVVGNSGWDAVLDTATLAPQEKRTFSCDLRGAFPDGTPKLNPADLKGVQIMLAEVINRPAKSGTPEKKETYLRGKITKPLSVEVSALRAEGAAPEWKRPPGRFDVPAIENQAPAPGKRVRYRLAQDADNGIYSILNLPEDWSPGKSFPVIVEFPGNQFYALQCYSTGQPDQCVMGYGMSKGRGAICVGMPFINRSSGKIVEDGWGNADDTADYALQMVEEVCAKFGGDRENVMLTGFSRGAIACGYIGLRNDRIAALWKGFHACQHYDGLQWNRANEGFLERAARFRGKAVFQTDNSQEKYQPVMDAMKTTVTWARSGLNAHATAMFLDDRPSTCQLREWFWQLVGR
jgi:hypothetical protein